METEGSRTSFLSRGGGALVACCAVAVDVAAGACDNGVRVPSIALEFSAPDGRDERGVAAAVLWFAWVACATPPAVIPPAAALGVLAHDRPSFLYPSVGGCGDNGGGGVDDAGAFDIASASPPLLLLLLLLLLLVSGLVDGDSPST